MHHRARRAVTFSLVGLLGLAGLVSVSTVAAQADPPTTTFAATTTVNGSSDFWRDDEVRVDDHTLNDLQISLSHGEFADGWSLELMAPDDDPLTAGDYEGATETYLHETQDTHLPAVGISSPRDSCDKASGSFSVKDLDRSTHRLWIVYEIHCYNSTAAFSGEVKVNEPDADPDLLVAPDEVHWPAGYLGASTPTEPVRVVNTGNATIHPTASVTAGAEDFSVVSSTCATLAPGASCRFDLRFRPTAVGGRSGSLDIDDGASVHDVPLSGAGIPGQTFLKIHSQKGDTVGHGRSWSASAPDSDPWAFGTPSRVHFTWSVGHDQEFDMDFAPSAGHQLASGSTFVGTERYPFNDDGRPGLDVTSRGVGCNVSWGRFTVHHASYSHGQMTAFSATFEQHCQDDEPALLGSVSWHSDDGQPVPHSDTTPPAAVTGLHAGSSQGVSSVSWTNPTDEDWKDTVVVPTVGKPAASLSDGQPAYVGRGTSSLASLGSTSKDVSVAVFSRDHAGNTSRSTLTLQGSRLSFAGSDGRVRSGDEVQLRGHLVDAGTGEPLAGRTIAITPRPHYRHRDSSPVTTTTNARGGWSLTVRPAASTDYFAAFGGDAGHYWTRATKGRFTVSVDPRVGVDVDETSAPAHHTFAFATRVRPARDGDRVALQRLDGRTWRTITAGSLTGGETTLRSRPATPGTYVYRVLRPRDQLAGTGYSREVRIRVSGDQH